MKRVNLSLPQFGFVVSTRAALGVGIGLLVAGKLTESRRKRLGKTLLSIGAATTVPALFAVFGRKKQTVIA